MAEGRIVRQQVSWRQEQMFDPETIKVEMTIWLDGPMGRCQVGWAVFDGTDRECVEMEVRSTAPLDEVTERAVDLLRPLLERHRNRVAPF